MEVAGETALISEEEYLTTVYQPDAEFVDRVLEERAMGEDDHSAWQMAITEYFFMHVVEWNTACVRGCATRSRSGAIGCPMA